MTKDELTEIIRKEVRNLAFETLRTNYKKESNKDNNALKSNSLSEEDIEFAIFHGGNKPNKNNKEKSTTTIKEGYNNGLPQINKSEIIQFEDSFEESLKEVDGASVIFDKQINGESMSIGIGNEGIEAGASGIVEMGKNGKIEWAYSLKNGLNITTKNLNVDKGNKNVIEKLYSNYYSWQKDWREKLTITPGQEDNNEVESFSQESEIGTGSADAPPTS